MELHEKLSIFNYCGAADSIGTLERQFNDICTLYLDCFYCKRPIKIKAYKNIIDAITEINKLDRFNDNLFEMIKTKCGCQDKTLLLDVELPHGKTIKPDDDFIKPPDDE